MADHVYLNITGSCDIPLNLCNDTVYVCLGSEWESKTESGLPFVIGTVVSVCEFEHTYIKQTGCGPVSTKKTECKYQVEVALDQFLVDPETTIPYVPTDADAGEIFPYVCALEYILERLETITPTFECDFLEDCFDNDTITQTGPGGTWEANETTLTVVDTTSINLTAAGTNGHEVTGVVKLSLDVGNVLEIRADGLYVNPSGNIVVSTDANNELVAGSDGGAYIDCATILACLGVLDLVSDDAGNILTEGTDGLVFLNCAAVDACIPPVPNTVSSLGSCSGNIGANYMVRSSSFAGATLNLNSAPEHRTIHTDALSALVVAGVIPNGVLTVIPGTLITNHLIVNNPSSCRTMAWTVFPRCQITVDPIVAGSTSGVLMQVSVNGGSYINVINFSREVVGGSFGMQCGFPDALRGTVAASASVIFNTRAVSNSNGAGNTAEYAFPDLNFIGNTQ